MMTDLDYNISRPSAGDWNGIVSLAERLNLDSRSMQPEQFVICRGDEAVIGIGRIRQHPECKELCTLGVEQAYRGRGIGAAIVAKLLEGTDEPVFVVTEIPGYFTRQGFEITEPGIASLEEKRLICLNELACSKPVIMIKQPK